MELDITAFVAEAEPFNFSASMAEMGQNAGRITWANAKEEAERTPLLTTIDQIEAAKEYFGDFGAWSDEEITDWDTQTVNALLIQFISGDLRELEGLCADDNGEIDWVKAETLASEGVIAGRIYPGDDGKIYCYIGN